MKHKLAVAVMAAVMAISTVGLFGCDETSGIYGEGGETKTYAYIGGIIKVEMWGVEETQYAYRYTPYFNYADPESFGRNIIVGKQSMDFDGTVLSQFNSAKYTMSGNDIVFSNAALQDKFKYATYENGAIQLCSSNDLIVYEYHTWDYVAPTYKITFDYGELQDDSWVTEMEVKLFSAIGELPSPQKEGYRFIGWYTFGACYFNNRLFRGFNDYDYYNGFPERVTETILYDWAQDITLYAHWTELQSE